MKPRLLHFRASALVAFLLFGLAALVSSRAQSPATGTIEGRVLNVTTGAYLSNARVNVEGTTLQAFTNQYGEFRLTGVPAGAATVKAFHTGLPEQSAQVQVSAGQTATKDFELSFTSASASVATAPGAAVQLDAFVVAAAKETNASAIAVNEQRFAPNIKNVVASDEFGAVAEGNVGEFLKFLPGVTLDYQSADARAVSVRGLPSYSTAVTMDGNSIANTGAGVANRVFEFDQLSINNVSRVEVTKGPTPESRADAIGGTVNLVSKSAFERSRAELSYRAYLALNHQHQQDIQFLSFSESPGPGREPSTKVKPSFEFTYVNPVTKNFGFTITGMNSNIFNQQYQSIPRWSSANPPSLNSYSFNDGPKTTSRYSIGATADWRIAPRDVISVGGSWNAFDAFFNNKTTAFGIGTPTAFDPTFTQGNNAGTVTQNTATRRAARRTYVANVKYRHDGPVWKLNAGAYLSNSKGLFRDMDYGWFNATRFNLNNVRLRFEGNNENRPDTITALNAAGTAPVDFRQLSNYLFTFANTNPVDSYNTNKGANASASRHFDLGVPVLVKAGVDARRAIAEARRPFRQWNFVGPDRVANNADNLVSNYDLVDVSNSSVPAPYGNGRWQYGSPWKAYDLFRANPAFFQHDDAFEVQQNALNSNVITEDILAGYVRFDVRLFENKLWIVAGARYEQTRDNGYGPLDDITRTFQRDAAGNLIRVNGVPQRIVADAVTLNRLRYTDRGSHVTKDYGDYYPSVNVTYNITPSLIARASYADTLARPNYTNIIPGTTLPDPSTTNRVITINNVNLKPWTARNYDLSLSYYPEKGGELSAGVFRKDIKDFFGSRDTDVTAELLDQYGIDETYLTGGYLIRTLQNVGAARVTGVEFNYRQPLRFLPHWARGINVRYNLTQLHLAGNGLSDFSTFIRRSQNWGISLDRPTFGVRFNWNYRGRQRQGAIAAPAEPGTYNYMNPRLTLDVEADYRFSKRLGLFVGARNVTAEPFIVERYGPNTPAYARRFQRDDYGVAISAGVKGSF